MSDDSWCSHAWLICNGVVVDITADLFGQAPVIVTEASPWHDQWRITSALPPEISPHLHEALAYPVEAMTPTGGAGVGA